MTENSIPQELVDMLDSDAGKEHSREGRVLTSLTRILTRYDEITACRTVRGMQAIAWDNKVTKGFNITNVPLEFCLLSGEVAEAFDAWRKMDSSVDDELADVQIFLLGLAEMLGVDLQAAVEAKMKINERREYSKLSNGTPVKDGEDA
jgi:hypothetical protein